MINLKTGIVSAQFENRKFQLLWKGVELVLLVGKISKTDTKSAESALPNAGDTKRTEGWCSFDDTKNELVLWASGTKIPSTLGDKIKIHVKKVTSLPVKEVTLATTKAQLRFINGQEAEASGAAPTNGAAPSAGNAPAAEQKVVAPATQPQAGDEAAAFAKRFKRLEPACRMAIGMVPASKDLLERRLQEANDSAKPGSYPAALLALDKLEAAIKKVVSRTPPAKDQPAPAATVSAKAAPTPAKAAQLRYKACKRILDDASRIFNPSKRPGPKCPLHKGQHETLDAMWKDLKSLPARLEESMNLADIGSCRFYFDMLSERLTQFEDKIALYERIDKHSQQHSRELIELESRAKKVAETEAQGKELERFCALIRSQIDGKNDVESEPGDDADPAINLRILTQRLEEIGHVNKKREGLLASVEAINIVDGLDERQRAEAEATVAEWRTHLDLGLDRGGLSSLESTLNMYRDVNARRGELLAKLDAATDPQGVTEQEHSALEAHRSAIRGMIEDGSDPEVALSYLTACIAEIPRVRKERDKFLKEFQKLETLQVVDYPSGELTPIETSRMFGGSIEGLRMVLDSGKDPSEEMARYQQKVGEYQAAQAQSEENYRLLDEVPLPKDPTRLQLVQQLKWRQTIRDNIGRGLFQPGDIESLKAAVAAIDQGRADS